jgi:SPP1 gp7 family putative phage head morphogenesis protein
VAKMAKTGNRKAKPLTLRPVHPNAGIEAAYRKRMTKLIDRMNSSVVYWLKSAYRNNEPVMAQDDALPSSALRAAIRKLAKRWQKQFDELAPKLADYFSLAVSERTDGALQAMLRKGGFSVKFKLTRAQHDVLKATVNQNVTLIKSIPSQYFTNVEGIVMRSVQTGRDLGQLTKDLQNEFGVTKRRAAFIARDQNNKATAALTRERQASIGVTEAVWMHSGAGKHPRPSHVKAGRDGVRYDIKIGWFDPEVRKFILPGELPNCRCVSRAVIPGFT